MLGGLFAPTASQATLHVTMREEPVPGDPMRARTARWVAGGIAAGSVALMAAGLVLAYVDRHALPADVTSWDFADVYHAGGAAGVPKSSPSLAPNGQWEAVRPGRKRGWALRTTAPVG